MTTLLVDSPDRLGERAAEDAAATKVDVERLTRIYTAPQACIGRGGPCLYTSQCCRGLECYGSAPAHLVFGTCIT